MKLSVRETQILDLLRQGLTNKEIGQELEISPHTVRDRVSDMLQRFRLNGRTELAARYAQKALPLQLSPKRDRRTAGDRRASHSPPPHKYGTTFVGLHL